MPMARIAVNHRLQATWGVSTTLVLLTACTPSSPENPTTTQATSSASDPAGGPTSPDSGGNNTTAVSTDTTGSSTDSDSGTIETTGTGTTDPTDSGTTDPTDSGTTDPTGTTDASSDTELDSNSDSDTDSDPCLVFDQTHGGTLNDYVNAVVAIPEGGFAAAGRTESFGGGSSDAWLLRLDVDGSVLWEKTFGAETFEALNDLAIMPDGGFALVGITQSQQNSLDWWTIRTDSNGTLLWDAAFGTPNADHASSVVVDDSGVTVAGTRDRIGKGTGRFGLIRYDDTGQTIWEKAYGDDVDEQLAYALVATEDGYAIAGTAYSNFWLVRTDKNGEQLWSQAYDLADNIYERALGLTALSDGFVLAGWASLTDEPGQSDTWVVRTDELGEKLWDRTFDFAHFEWASDLVVRDEGFVLTGYTHLDGDNNELMIFAIDGTGELLWQRDFGGAMSDVGNGVALVPNGDLVFAGGTSSKGAGETDAWFLRTSANGTLMCP